MRYRRPSRYFLFLSVLLVSALSMGFFHSRPELKEINIKSLHEVAGEWEGYFTRESNGEDYPISMSITEYGELRWESNRGKKLGSMLLLSGKLLWTGTSVRAWTLHEGKETQELSAEGRRGTFLLERTVKKNFREELVRLAAERKRLAAEKKLREDRARLTAESARAQPEIVARKKQEEALRLTATAQKRKEEETLRLATERRRKEEDARRQAVLREIQKERERMATERLKMAEAEFLRKERERERREATEERRLAAEIKWKEEQARLAADRARVQQEAAARRRQEESNRLASARKRREAETASRAKRVQVASAQMALLRELAKLKEEMARMKRRRARVPRRDMPESLWRFSGSGFYMKGSRHILTNYHVIKNSKVIQVSFPNGERYRGRVVVADKNNDLALVKLLRMKPKEKGFGFRRFFFYGARIQVGEEIHALGYPLGASLSRNPSMVSGRISSTTGMEDNLSQFRMTAPINAGNSGGPIVNDKGELVGIAKGGHVQRGVEGVRFAIKTSAAAMVLEQIPTSENFSIEVRARKRTRSPAQIFRELSPYVVMIEVR